MPPALRARVPFDRQPFVFVPAAARNSTGRFPIKLLAVIPAALTALILSLPSHAARPRHFGVTPFWWSLGTCETGHIGAPGDGAPRFDWGKDRRHLEGPLYEGFVGFAASTWSAWAGALELTRRYPHAYDAPPVVQMLVARYGLSQHGFWGCLHSHPDIYSEPGR